MRSILLLIHEDDCLEARFQTALDLARQFDAHLTCLQAVPYEFGVPGDFYGAMGAQLALEFSTDARRIRKEYEARLAKEDVRWDWHDSDGPATRLLARFAPLSDLVIFGAHNPVGGTDKPSSLVADALGEVRAPMLVVPADAKGFSAQAPVAIAWNGSAEAAHAIQGALPLLQTAAAVHILTVSETDADKRPKLPARSAAEYLARHGIEAEVVEIPHDRNDQTSIADKLINSGHARDVGCIVMGGYGHSRLRERLLGGVTRDLLSDPKIPLLLSH